MRACAGVCGRVRTCAGMCGRARACGCVHGEILYESMINHDLAFEDMTLKLRLLESSSGCSRFKNIYVAVVEENRKLIPKHATVKSCGNLH